MVARRFSALVGVALIVGLCLGPATAAMKGLRILKVTCDVSTAEMFIEGANFGPNVRVFLGDTSGELVEQTVTYVDSTLIEADMTSVDPGTYYLKVKKGKTSRAAFITVGAVGPEGPQGPQGPQGAAGVSGFQRISCGPYSTPHNVGMEAFTCTCPVGKVAVGGGIADVRSPITVANSRDFNVAALHPSTDSKWRARWFNGSGATASVMLYTVCITAN